MLLQPSQMALPQSPMAGSVPNTPQGPKILQPSQLSPQPQNASPSPQQAPQTAPQGPQLSDTGSFMGNVANSAGNFASSIGNAIMHPINTVENIGKGLIGGGENLAALATGGKPANDQFTQVANQIGSYITQRYGSLQAAKTTAYQDPVGFLADASAVLSGVGGAVGAVGDAADVSQVSDVGNAISKAGDITNPINAVTKPIEMGINWAKSGLENLGPSLEEGSLRLTPAQKVSYASKLGDVSNYISQEIPLGSPESRYASAVSNVNDFENQIQTFLKNDAKDITVYKPGLIEKVENLKSSFAGERDALQIDSQIDGFKKLLESKYGEDISVSDLNKLKRSTYESAFNQAGTKVSDAVEYQIGDLLRQKIEGATEGLKLGDNEDIGEFNQRYGTAITAKKLLKVAMGRPQVDFVSRMVMDATGGLVGSAFGGPVGAAIGTAAGNFISKELPATAIKSGIGRVAGAVSNIIPKVNIPSAAINAASRVNQATQANKSSQQSTTKAAKSKRETRVRLPKSLQSTT